MIPQIDQIKEKMLGELSDKYELKLVVLFGSQVSGRTHQESDYDVAYLSEKKLSSEEKTDFMYDLMPVSRVQAEYLKIISDKYL